MIHLTLSKTDWLVDNLVPVEQYNINGKPIDLFLARNRFDGRWEILTRDPDDGAFDWIADVRQKHQARAVVYEISERLLKGLNIVLR